MMMMMMMICMFSVYSPKPDYLVPMLRKLPMFHDDTYPLLQKHNKKTSELPLVMPYVWNICSFAPVYPRI